MSPRWLSRLFDLTGRTALVTGSTRGIGLTLARALGSAGAQVIVHGRVPEQAAAVAASLRDEGIAAGSRAFDLADADAIATAIEAVQEEYGALHVLVNNAGFIERPPLLELDLAAWREMLDVNLTSALLLARAVVPEMIAAGSGKIVNVCSVLSELARPDTGPYAASKAALKMLTQSMCAEWARHGIQVNGLGPRLHQDRPERAPVQRAGVQRVADRAHPRRALGRVVRSRGRDRLSRCPRLGLRQRHVLYVDGGLLAVV